MEEGVFSTWHSLTPHAVVWTAVLPSHTIHIQFEVNHFPCLCIWGKSCSLTQRRSSALSIRISHWAHPRQKEHCTVQLGQCRRRLSHKFWGGAASTPGHSIKKEKQSTRSVKNGKRIHIHMCKRIHIHMCLFLHEESTREVEEHRRCELGKQWLTQPGIQPV